VKYLVCEFLSLVYPAIAKQTTHSRANRFRQNYPSTVENANSFTSS